MTIEVEHEYDITVRADDFHDRLRATELKHYPVYLISPPGVTGRPIVTAEKGQCFVARPDGLGHYWVTIPDLCSVPTKKLHVSYMRRR